jgi:hypothetical protein
MSQALYPLGKEPQESTGEETGGEVYCYDLGGGAGGAYKQARGFGVVTGFIGHAAINS